MSVFVAPFLPAPAECAPEAWDECDEWEFDMVVGGVFIKVCVNFMWLDADMTLPLPPASSRLAEQIRKKTRSGFYVMYTGRSIYL